MLALISIVCDISVGTYGINVYSYTASIKVRSAPAYKLWATPVLTNSNIIESNRDAASKRIDIYSGLYNEKL